MRGKPRAAKAVVWRDDGLSSGAPTRWRLESWTEDGEPYHMYYSLGWCDGKAEVARRRASEETGLPPEAIEIDGERTRGHSPRGG